MTFYFAGGEIAPWMPSDSNVHEATAFAGYDTNFARCGLFVFSGSSFAFTPDLNLPDEFYIHFAAERFTSGSNTESLLVLATGSTEVFQVYTDGTTIYLKAYIASSWTTLGSAVIPLNSTLQDMDLYIKGNSATGICRLYVSGTKRIEALSADLSAVTGIQTLRSYSMGSGGHNISQIIVADEPTIGMKLATRYPNGAGAVNDWTNSYADVDETIYSDVDFVSSSSANQVAMYAQTGPIPSSYTVRAVAVSARAKCGASGPQNLQLGVRVASTNYFSTTKALDVGYGGPFNIWQNNPATSSAWLDSEISTLQIGMKSIA